METSRLLERIAQVLEGKVGFPPEMYTFQGEVAQLAVGPSLSKQSVRGMD